MTDAEILTMLQADLGELFANEARKTYLQQCITSAREYITREGVTLTDSIGDGQLVEMYAAYLVRKRATNEPMPRMLRWALYNRLFSQKAQVSGNAT